MTKTNDPAMIARMMIDNHYTMTDLADLHSYLIAELFASSDDDLADRATLIDALDTDIRDALHNANLDFFLYAPTDTNAIDYSRPSYNLDDDAYELLADFIMTNSTELAELIADHFLT